MNVVYMPRLLERHAAMLQFQETIRPFTATVRELMPVLGVCTTSHAWRILRDLQKRGLVVYRNGHYYAVEAQ